MVWTVTPKPPKSAADCGFLRWLLISAKDLYQQFENYNKRNIYNSRPFALIRGSRIKPDTQLTLKIFSACKRSEKTPFVIDSAHLRDCDKAERMYLFAMNTFRASSSASSSTRYPT